MKIPNRNRDIAVCRALSDPAVKDKLIKMLGELPPRYARGDQRNIDRIQAIGARTEEEVLCIQKSDSTTSPAS
jgi:hypothetical protein